MGIEDFFRDANRTMGQANRFGANLNRTVDRFTTSRDEAYRNETREMRAETTRNRAGIRRNESDMDYYESNAEREGFYRGVQEGGYGDRPVGRYPQRSEYGGYAQPREGGYARGRDRDDRGGRGDIRDYDMRVTESLGRISLQLEDVARARTPEERSQALEQYVRSLDSVVANDGMIHVPGTVTTRERGQPTISIPPGTYTVGAFTQEIAMDLGIDGALAAESARTATAAFANGRPVGAPERGRSAAPNNVPTTPLTRIAGNGETVDLATSNATGSARVNLLVNSDVVTDRGQALTNGQRFDAVIRQIDADLKALPPVTPGAPSPQALEILAGFNDPTFARNMQALYEGSTAAERETILASMRGLATTAGTIDPNIQAHVNDMIGDLSAPQGTAAEQARTQAQRTAELAQLKTIGFTAEFLATEAGQEAKKDYDAILQQQEAMNRGGGGGPFGSFFTQLFSMIGNILSGNPERNQSPEEFLATLPANSITPEGSEILARVNAGQTTAVPPPPPPPSTETGNGQTPPTPTVTPQVLQAARQAGQGFLDTPITGLSPDRLNVIQTQVSQLGFENLSAAEQAMGFRVDGLPDAQVQRGLDAAIRAAGLASTGVTGGTNVPSGEAPSGQTVASNPLIDPTQRNTGAALG